MKLSKVKLGDYIEAVDNRNINETYTTEDICGISITKTLIKTKADTTNLSVKNYKILKCNDFTYCTVTSRNGNKISLAYNDQKDCIISSIYPVFRVKDNNKLLPRYLMMFFNRPEFDRYARFNSWGSARETFSWDDFCDIELVIPPIEIQKKYVAIYESMLKNLHTYEKGLDDLKLVCDGYIENLRKTNELFRVGDYILYRNEKNKDNGITLEQGINIEKVFITPQRGNSNLSGRKIVRKGDIAYCTQLNNENVAIAYREGEDCVVSSVYDVLYVKDFNKLDPKYLFLWFGRSEFGRYVYWKSTGTSYEFLDSENINELQIPIPNIMVQKNIVEIMEICNRRKKYINIMKEKLKNICPILIRGSIKECEKEV